MLDQQCHYSDSGKYEKNPLDWHVSKKRIEVDHIKSPRRVNEGDAVFNVVVSGLSSIASVRAIDDSRRLLSSPSS